jgi:hypothetical protein
MANKRSRTAFENFEGDSGEDNQGELREVNLLVSSGDQVRAESIGIKQVRAYYRQLSRYLHFCKSLGVQADLWDSCLGFLEHLRSVGPSVGIGNSTEHFYFIFPQRVPMRGREKRGLKYESLGTYATGIQQACVYLLGNPSQMTEINTEGFTVDVLSGVLRMAQSSTKQLREYKVGCQKQQHQGVPTVPRDFFTEDEIRGLCSVALRKFHETSDNQHILRR